MDRLKIVTDNNGNQIVLIPKIIFSNKQNINWNEVEMYLEKYIGEFVDIDKTKDIIYIGN